MDKQIELRDGLDLIQLASYPIEIVPGVSVQRNQTILDRKFPNAEILSKEQIAIVISDITTIMDIRNAWSIICRERDNLRKKAGTDLETSYKLLVHEIHESKVQGSSYAEIAYDLNFDFGLFLLGFYFMRFVPIKIAHDLKKEKYDYSLALKIGVSRMREYINLTQVATKDKNPRVSW